MRTRDGGAYGSAKAAMNHLTLTIAKEEKDITAIAIRPGTVDTQMQQDIREKHDKAMDTNDAKKFVELKSSGSLLKPEQPAHAIAKLVLDAPNNLSGQFLQWNADELKAFQEWAWQSKVRPRSERGGKRMVDQASASLRTPVSVESIWPGAARGGYSPCFGISARARSNNMAQAPTGPEDTCLH